MKSIEIWIIIHIYLFIYSITFGFTNNFTEGGGKNKSSQKIGKEKRRKNINSPPL